MKETPSARPLLIVICISLLVWGIVGFVVPAVYIKFTQKNICESEQALRGQFGDQFGAANALLQAFALSFIAYSIYHASISYRLDVTARRADAMLKLREMFSNHKEIHISLRDGKWNEFKDWPSLDSYMGLFEHCELFLKDGLLDAKSFEYIYGYRIRNILAYRDIIDSKLVKEKAYWKLFIDLCNRYEYKCD